VPIIVESLEKKPPATTNKNESESGEQQQESEKVEEEKEIIPEDKDINLYLKKQKDEIRKMMLETN